MYGPQRISDKSHWDLVDIFTLHQTASLWCGWEPSTVNEYGVSVPHDFSAIYQMLCGAVAAGDLMVDASKNLLSRVGNDASSLVTRHALEEYARSKRQFPAFLFDTLMPGQEELNNLAHTPSKPMADSIAPSKNRGGRPQKYDWDQFTMEIIRIANAPDGLPETRAKLTELMLQWFADNFGEEPAESSVKTRISKIYSYLEGVKNSRS